jgi:redox-sensitive bicupin YhaK (pirin superfamily)
METVIHKSGQRGQADYGWLQTRYSFSFANYYNPKMMNFGALRVINDDIIEGGTGFDQHPHNNMEIATIVLEGELEHRDSMGHISLIKAGEVQVMSAGTGIFHSEYNHLENEALKLFQIWILPKEQNVRPRYDQKKFEIADRLNQWQTLISPNDKNALYLNQDTCFSRVALDSQKSISYKTQLNGNGLYIMVIEGEVNIAGYHLSRRDAIGIWDTDSIEITAIQNADILLIDVPMNPGGL